MGEQWRILVIEDDEHLSQILVNTLSKDGYEVQVAANAAHAMQKLWTEEYVVVVYDLKVPEDESYELLQWLRIYRPTTRVIVVGSAHSVEAREQALANGASAYLNRPLDPSRLREELSRLIQQTGFSADLDSFDLLDVIQAVAMSYKNIALLVNTGIEERGILRFQNGELVWAEYALLRGEEAFFALAAHKHGRVIHQPSSGQIVPNVKQSLSRLILQALQYRAKYAQAEQLGGEMPLLPQSTPLTVAMEEEEHPLQRGTGEEALPSTMTAPPTQSAHQPIEEVDMDSAAREWWEQTGKYAGMGHKQEHIRPPSTLNTPFPAYLLNDDVYPVGNNGSRADSAAPTRQSVSQRPDLPSWLTDQPTLADMPAVRPSSLNGTAHVPIPPRPASAEWQPPAHTPSAFKTTEPIVPKAVTGGQQKISPASPQHLSSLSEWQPPDGHIPIKPTQSGPLRSLTRATRAGEIEPMSMAQQNGTSTAVEQQATDSRHPAQRQYNYRALNSALRTLETSIHGFIAAAIVGLDGQPIAQIGVDELDISRMCKQFSTILNSVSHSLDQHIWGSYEETLISSADHYILLRMIGAKKNAFLALITSRDADPRESAAATASVEHLIANALQH